MAEVKLRWLNSTSTPRLTQNAVYSVVGWTDSAKPIVLCDNGTLYGEDTLPGNWELVSVVADTILFP